MKRALIIFICMAMGYTFVAILPGSPPWAAVIGGWAFWAAVRPKEF